MKEACTIWIVCRIYITRIIYSYIVLGLVYISYVSIIITVQLRSACKHFKHIHWPVKVGVINSHNNNDICKEKYWFPTFL